MLQNMNHFHRRTFSFIHGISLKVFVSLDTRCALKLSSNSPEESVSGEINTIKSPCFIQTADAVPRSEQPSSCIISWINPADALPSSSFKVHFNIVLPLFTTYKISDTLVQRSSNLPYI